MSKHFSANQFDGAFKLSHLQNWEIPKCKFDKRPKKFEGFSVFISDDNGRLLSNATRSKESPWGNFVGTWDMPTKVPGSKILNKTARLPSSANSLKKMKDEFDEKLKESPLIVKPGTYQRKIETINDAEVKSEKGPSSKAETPTAPLSSGPHRTETPSNIQMNVPTPLGLQEADVAMGCLKDPATSTYEIQAQAEAPEPKCFRCDAPLRSKLTNICDRCQNSQKMRFSTGKSGTIKWPEPKSLS